MVKKKGPVKLSEIVLDRDMSAIPAPANENTMTVASGTEMLATEAVMKGNFFLSSSKEITWSPSISSIVIPQDTEINGIFLQSPNSVSVNSIRFRYTGQSGEVLGGATPNPGASVIQIGIGQMLFLEIDRSAFESLPAGFGTIDLDFITSGARLSVYSEANFPKLNAINPGFQSSICIPIAYRVTSSRIAWLPSNIHWDGEFTSLLGQQRSTGSLPVGVILPITDLLGNFDTPPDQTTIDSVAPGWMLCDGQTVSNTDSPFDGMALPTLNDNRFLNGAKSSIATDSPDSAESYSGSNTFTLRADHNARHSHDAITTSNLSDPGIAYLVDWIGMANTRLNAIDLERQERGLNSINHYHRVSTVGTGGGNPHQNTPYSLSVIYVIKVV